MLKNNRGLGFSKEFVILTSPQVALYEAANIKVMYNWAEFVVDRYVLNFQGIMKRKLPFLIRSSDHTDFILILFDFI